MKKIIVAIAFFAAANLTSGFKTSSVVQDTAQATDLSPGTLGEEEMTFVPPGGDVVVKFEYDHVTGAKNTLQKITEKADTLLRAYGNKIHGLQGQRQRTAKAKVNSEILENRLMALEEEKAKLATEKVTSGEKLTDAVKAKREADGLKAELDGSIADLEGEKERSLGERTRLERELQRKQQDVLIKEKAEIATRDDIRKFATHIEREDQEIILEARRNDEETSQLQRAIGEVETRAADLKAWIAACMKAKRDKRKTAFKAQRAEREHEAIEAYNAEKQRQVDELAKKLEEQNKEMTAALNFLDAKKAELARMRVAEEAKVADGGDDFDLFRIESILEEIEKKQGKLKTKSEETRAQVGELVKQMEVQMSGVMEPSAQNGDGVDRFRFMRKELAEIRARLESPKCKHDMTIPGLLIRDTDDISGCKDPEKCSGWTEKLDASISAITSVTKCMEEEFTILCDLMARMNSEIQKSEDEEKASRKKDEDVRKSIVKTGREIEGAGREIARMVRVTGYLETEKKRVDGEIRANAAKKVAIERAVDDITSQVHRTEDAIREQARLCGELSRALADAKAELTRVANELIRKQKQREDQKKAHVAVMEELNGKLLTVQECVKKNQAILAPLVAELFGANEDQKTCMNWRDDMNCERTENPFSDKESCVANPRHLACKWRDDECRFTSSDSEGGDLNAELGKDIITELQRLQEASQRAGITATRMVEEVQINFGGIIDEAAEIDDNPGPTPDQIERSAFVRAAVAVVPRNEVDVEETDNGYFEISFPSLMPAAFMPGRFGCPKEKVCPRGRYTATCARERENDGKLCATKPLDTLDCMSNVDDGRVQTRATLEKLRTFLADAIKQSTDESVQCQVVSSFYKKAKCSTGDPPVCEAIPPKDGPKAYYYESMKCRSEYVIRYLSETKDASGKAHSNIASRLCPRVKKEYAYEMPRAHFVCGKNACAEEH
eukprot:g820.t1